jgi:hypothetical protein
LRERKKALAPAAPVGCYLARTYDTCKSDASRAGDGKRNYFILNLDTGAL